MNVKRSIMQHKIYPPMNILAGGYIYANLPVNDEAINNIIVCMFTYNDNSEEDKLRPFFMLTKFTLV